MNDLERQVILELIDIKLKEIDRKGSDVLISLSEYARAMIEAAEEVHAKYQFKRICDEINEKRKVGAL